MNVIQTSLGCRRFAPEVRLRAPELAQHLAWDVEADREAVEHELEDRVLLHRAREVLRLRQRSPTREQQGSWAADGSQLHPAGSLGGR